MIRDWAFLRTSEESTRMRAAPPSPVFLSLALLGKRVWMPKLFFKPVLRVIASGPRVSSKGIKRLPQFRAVQLRMGHAGPGAQRGSEHAK